MIVFTNGCFDILHVGHFNLLSACRVLAGVSGQVYVAIDSNEKVRKDKGPQRPINTFDQRVENIKALKYPAEFTYCRLRDMVERVFFFDTNEDLYNIIKEHKVDLIVKGSDWKGNVVGSDLAPVHYIEMLPNISSTTLEQKILLKHGLKK